MKNHISFAAAYWQQNQTNAHNPALNVAGYTRFETQVTVKGFTYAADRTSINSIIPKDIRISSFENGSWQTVWEGELKEEESTTVMLKKPTLGKYFKVQIFTHYGPFGLHNDLISDEYNVPYRAVNDFNYILKESDAKLEFKTAGEFFQMASPITKDKVNCRSQEGVKTQVFSNEVIFTNSFMSMSFSLMRPLSRLLSVFSGGGKGNNLLYPHANVPFGLVSGPRAETAEGDIPPTFLKADIRCEGSGIEYKNVSPVEGLVWDYTFTVEKDAVYLKIDQRVSKRLKFISCEAWRWFFNVKESIQATLAYPVREGKSGRCRLPAALNFPHNGAVFIKAESGEETCYIKQDSWRDKGVNITGLECGVKIDKNGELYLEEGESSYTFKITPTDIGVKTDEKDIHPALKNVWPAVFGFRPEYFGMSNNSSSLNCHFVQHVYADMAKHTKDIEGEISIMELCGYTLELSLNNGMGYGSNREYYIDSMPSVLIGAGVYVKDKQNLEWAERNYNAIKKNADYMLSLCDKNGLVASARLTGNSGTHRWSTNWWDIISFGYLDAFVNALSYRAFKETAYIARFTGNLKDEKNYLDAAKKLKENYFNCFYIEETNRLAGWKSKDGKLHDYAFTFVQGIAAAYNLIPKDKVKSILKDMENLRVEAGYEHFNLGLPGNLLPVNRKDYTVGRNGSPLTEHGYDAFGIYENGGATLSQTYFYFKALAQNGFEIANTMEREFLDAFSYGDVFGGLGSGKDWKNWQGLNVGYEGLLSDQFYVLLAIAEHKKII